MYAACEGLSHLDITPGMHRQCLCSQHPLQVAEQAAAKPPPAKRDPRLQHWEASPMPPMVKQGREREKGLRFAEQSINV